MSEVIAEARRVFVSSKAMPSLSAGRPRPTLRSRFALGAIALTALAVPWTPACADKKSAVMLAITTDMKAPKDVNVVSITVSTNNTVKHNVIGRVTPQGDVLLPATLAVVEPDDPNASIRVRVMAFQGRKPRVLRDVRTAIPKGGRVALLRIPLNFVDDGSAQGNDLPEGVVPAPYPGTEGSSSSGGPSADAGPNDAGSNDAGAPLVDGGSGSSGGTLASGEGFNPFDFAPNCPNQDDTVIDGECKDAYIDPASLPDYDEALVGSGKPEGGCFDVAKCFKDATAIGSDRRDTQEGGDAGAANLDGGLDGRDFSPRAITLDDVACSVQLNGANAANLNLAFVTPDTGECIQPGRCYIPLDSGDGGWKEEGGQIKLPSFVCKLLKSKNLQLVSSNGCAAKKESNPICLSAPPAVGSDGGVSEQTTQLYYADDNVSAVGGDGAFSFWSAGPNGILDFTNINENLDPKTPAHIELPASDLPWAFGPTLAPFEFTLTNQTGTAYLFDGTTKGTPPTSVTLAGGADGTALINAGSSIGGVHFFGSAQGIFRSDGTAATAQLVNITQNAPSNVTALLGPTFQGQTQYPLVYGTMDGKVGSCVNLQCTPSFDAGTGPVEALIRSELFPGVAYALGADGIYKVTQAEVPVQKFYGAQTAPLTINEKPYRRTMAMTVGCIVFTSASGVEWVSENDPSRHGVVAPLDQNALGVVTRFNGGNTPEGNPRRAAYWSRYAPAAQGGGIYVTKLPDECNGAPPRAAGADAGLDPRDGGK